MSLWWEDTLTRAGASHTRDLPPATTGLDSSLCYTLESQGLVGLICEATQQCNSLILRLAHTDLHNPIKKKNKQNLSYVTSTIQSKYH